MQQLLRVLAAIILAQGVAVTAAPVQAANGVVLVGCNLFSAGGPTVTFVQAAEVPGTTGAFRQAGSSAYRVSARRTSQIGLAPRSCPRLIGDGLAFQAMDVFGRDSVKHSGSSARIELVRLGAL